MKKVGLQDVHHLLRALKKIDCGEGAERFWTATMLQFWDADHNEPNPVVELTNDGFKVRLGTTSNRRAFNRRVSFELQLKENIFVCVRTLAYPRAYGLKENQEVRQILDHTGATKIYDNVVGKLLNIAA